VPTISAFYGITIRMYYDEHRPPHFHAYIGGHDISLSISTLEVLAGSLPRRALALVLEWAAEHRAELLANWELAEAHRPLQEIAPLE
jgi:hypothetical protein